jgi:hypothetical protein
VDHPIERTEKTPEAAMMTDLFLETTSRRGADGRPPAGLPMALELATSGVAVATILAVILAVCGPAAPHPDRQAAGRPAAAAEYAG